MAELIIVLNSVMVALCYNILIRQGELLQLWARYVNLSNWNNYIKKLLLCPHCVAGQLALWQCIYYSNFWVAIPISIVLVFYIVKQTND
jgi:hypothetical protein